MTRFGRAGLWICVLGVAGCAQQPPPSPAEPPDPRPAAEAAIGAAVKDWLAAAQAKDVDRFVSYYADDAVLLMEGMPDVSGKAALREAVTGMMQDPNFALSFTADTIEVARSGDLAFEHGSYTMTMSDSQKRPATQKGHYIVVWQKQADGAWKVVRDVPVSDAPAAPAVQ